MANLNDFKIIKNKSKILFELTHKDIEVDDIKKERCGFYYLVLESITGQKDTDNYKELIIDTEYNKIVNNISVDDLGIDAVYIDEELEEININLFNFKYREKFNDNNKEENSLSRSTKFLEYIQAEDERLILGLQDNKVRKNILEIREKLEGNKICNLKLYMVSNENKGFASSSNDYIEILKNKYGMEVFDIDLDKISNYCIPTTFNKKCEFMLTPEDFLSFSRDGLSTQNSLIVKISLIDLIRISSKNETLNKKYNLEDDDEIKNCNLDFSLLFDNVRGYLERSSYNKNIQKTIQTNPTEFFMFNNGITMTSEIIDSDSMNSGKKYLIKLENYQIVNGGQTIRSIFEYLQKHVDEKKIEKLRAANILVRIFKITKENIRLKNQIAEYTNSQNKIQDSDLKSVDEIQLQIEEYLKEHNILYRRKNGDLGIINREYDYIISKERLAQIIYSTKGFPNRVGNQKRKLFGEYYDCIFKKDLYLEDIPNLCKLYYNIEDIYKKQKKKFYDLKSFYVIYISKNYSKTIEESIEILENIIVQNKKENISEARTLLKNLIKEEIDKQLNN
ncbi:AIPR family protein [Treponema denticola]|uniref:AIPR family protein n=1 Tax=Treponema denticola TaxID=158 RepID=UPI0020A46B46|nr:AIPR family protein [Treponema denticola]UTD12305.1 AIPR family protein [Treponema denticola]